MESHNVIKIQKTIKAFANERKIISARIFLFSVLFMLEKNIAKQIRDANNNQTKWKSKFWGLIILRKTGIEVGKYIPVSNANAT